MIPFTPNSIYSFTLHSVFQDELWSEWYGRLSGTTHLIESSLDGDSIETVCVGTTHVIETSLDYVSAIKATFASGTVSGWFGGRYNALCFVRWKIVSND